MGALTYNATSRNLNLGISDAGGNSPFTSRFAQANPLLPHFLTPTANSMTLNIRVLTDDGSAYVGNGMSSGNLDDSDGVEGHVRPRGPISRIAQNRVGGMVGEVTPVPLKSGEQKRDV